MRSITALTIAALLSCCHAQPPFGYAEVGAENGSKWGDLNGKCNDPGQSPIKLYTSVATGPDLIKYQAYKKKLPSDDKFQGEFSNQKDARVRWFGDRTTKVELGTAPNAFTSELAKSLFGSTESEFEATNFIFRTGAEHRIDGHQHEVEMQILADPKAQAPGAPDNPVQGAAIAILFSKTANIQLSEAEQLVIDTFFDTLDLSNLDDPTVNFNTFGDLMSLVDMNNRWIYKGTYTEPPCEGPVIWTVLQTVYPIKEHHLKLIRSQTARGEAGLMKESGNWRVPFEASEANHAPVIVTHAELGAELATANDVNYSININIYNQNVGGKEKCKEDL